MNRRMFANPVSMGAIACCARIQHILIGNRNCDERSAACGAKAPCLHSQRPVIRRIMPRHGLTFSGGFDCGGPYAVIRCGWYERCGVDVEEVKCPLRNPQLVDRVEKRRISRLVLELATACHASELECCRRKRVIERARQLRSHGEKQAKTKQQQNDRECAGVPQSK